MSVNYLNDSSIFRRHESEWKWVLQKIASVFCRELWWELLPKSKFNTKQVAHNSKGS